MTELRAAGHLCPSVSLSVCQSVCCYCVQAANVLFSQISTEGAAQSVFAGGASKYRTCLNAELHFG